MKPKKTIVILDDNPSMAALIQEIIRLDSDFEVKEIIPRKETFLEKLSAPDFDLALIDISLCGREDGLDVLKEIKRRDIPLSTIILSAHDEDLYAQECL